MASPQTLSAAVTRIVGLLRSHETHEWKINGLKEDMYQLAPHVGRTEWNVLGDFVRKQERESSLVDSVDGSKWLTLRLDGSGFSKYLKVLRRAGLIPQGFSPEMADIMQRCVTSLMEYTHAFAGYTQSDEMTVLIPPARIVRGEQMPHLRNGRVQKLLSLSASHVSVLFNHLLMKLVPEGGLNGDEERLLGVFDCRLAQYDTLHEACGVLLWRGYDSGLNGVADAVFQQKGKIEGAGATMKLATKVKLEWLVEQSLLPLHPHQAYGSLFKKELLPHTGYNPVTNTHEETFRKKIVKQPEENILNLFKRCDLEYVDTRGEQREAEAEAEAEARCEEEAEEKGEESE